MGGWLSSLVWGGDPDQLNPVSGLSRRDVHRVQRSWAPIYKDCVANGAEILKRLFRAYPETKSFFKSMSHVPEEEYTTNPQFKAHIINLMTSLNLAIANLNQPDVVIAMMERIGTAHRRRNIKAKHFEHLKEVLVGIFVEVLKLDELTLQAWSKTVGFLYTHIFSTLEGETR